MSILSEKSDFWAQEPSPSTKPRYLGYGEASSTVFSILSHVSYFWLQEPSALRVSPTARAPLVM